ncbi:MAG: hypothetical protein Q4F71_06215 [Paracoccus sp. (in: a-proteobacteria)]|nr:hypothetical protein [Paracoccus sp. (in: a-proteobacteria)]
MPLPHFLLMLAAVILAAGATIWFGLQSGLPLAALCLGALVAALVLRMAMRDPQG